MDFLRRILALALCIAFSCASAMGQDDDAVNRAVYEKVHATVAQELSRDMPDLLLSVAKAFQGTPYVASTLEVEPESLRITMDRTDCILFVEMCVALTWTFKGLEIVQGGPAREAEPCYELFCRNVQALRYRDGVVDGYPSRLHYTSEWILQGERNAVFHEITCEKGERRPQTFGFMSTHPDSYRQLKSSPDNRERIAMTENRLTQQGPFWYLSQKKLQDPQVISSIKDGDIIAFVSNVAGLDITHIAIACTVGGKMHFIHASTSAMKVVIESRSLAEYAKVGVRVVRMN